MLKHVMYPRGFVALIPTQSLSSEPMVVSAGDEDVDALYLMLIGRTTTFDTWEFQKRVVALAARLFGRLDHWLSFQARNNDSIYGLNFEFLKDTVHFIRTGNRDADPITWYELLLDDPKPVTGIATNKRAVEAFGDLSDLDRNAIGRWVQHNNGFDDLLTSLHVIFGTHKRVATRPTVKTIG